MDTRVVYTLCVALMAVQLLVLVRISRSNYALQLCRGGIVSPHSVGHGKLHTTFRAGWLVCSVLEVWVFTRPFIKEAAVVGTSAVAIALVLRLLSMRSLGDRWTVQTIAVPGMRKCQTGIYRYLRHPNWTGVVLETVGLPLLHGAYASALVFAALEVVLLGFRTKDEESHLERMQAAQPRSDTTAERGRIAIIGAGAAGLAAADELVRRGLAFEVLERNPGPGGLWRYGHDSPLAKNTHCISPKRVQQFTDHPMPENLPDFPHHSDVLTYLEDFARQRGLLPHIQLATTVTSVRARSAGWDLDLATGETRHYSDVIIASGRHEKVRLPVYPGEFRGQMLHSKAYDGPHTLIDKRVLVVGSGQSAIDILTDAAIVARCVHHSTRAEFIGVPRYLLGAPTEERLEGGPRLLQWLVSKMSLPLLLTIIGRLSRLALRIKGNRGANWGLPRQTGTQAPLPTMGQGIYEFYAQGDIRHRVGIRRWTPTGVEFLDGRTGNYDVVIFATGYEPDFPYLEDELLPKPGRFDCTGLHRNIFHPRYDSLYFLGMVHPVGSHWTVFQQQAQLVATYIQAKRRNATSGFDRARTHDVGTDASLRVNKLQYISQLSRDKRGLSLAFASAKTATVPCPRDNTDSCAQTTNDRLPDQPASGRIRPTPKSAPRGETRV